MYEVTTGRKMNLWRDCISLLGLVAFPASVLANNLCGDPFKNAYGPFDYRTTTAEQRNVVEYYHFTDKVASLLGGEGGTIAGDLSYTLRVFPNHPQALLSLTRYALREKAVKVNEYSVECWLERAARFRPDDPMPPAIAGTYFARLGRTAEALSELDRAASFGSDDANLNYNLGLGYLEAKQYDKAMKHARQAYAAGFPLPGLRDRLIKVGAWKE